jgi:hypothetical protein
MKSGISAARSFTDRACLARAWPLLSPQAQNRVHWQVALGGPRRLPPATHMEWALRRYPPSNFVH